MTTLQPPIAAETPKRVAKTPAGALAVLALGGSETRRLLLHPALWGALAVYVAQWVFAAVGPGDRFPVLHISDQHTQVTSLTLAAGVFVAVHMAVLRPVRDEAGEFHSVAVLDPWQRMAAHLLSAVAAALLAAVLTAARISYLAARSGAVGSPSVTELVTGPVIVLLAGVLAVFVGCLTRSLAAGPVVLVVLGVVSVAGALASTASWRWFGLFAVEDGPPLPPSLVHRPAGMHLLYLLALVTLLGAAALLRSGQRGPVIAVLTVTALLGSAAAGAAQLSGVPKAVVSLREQATDSPARSQKCTTVASVTYCYFPDFAGRQHQWAQVTAGMMRWVPERNRQPRYFVRQHVYLARPEAKGVIAPAPVERWTQDDRSAGTAQAVAVGTDWGTGSDRSARATIGFSVSMAERLTRHENRPTSPATPLCGARAVVTLWLAAQATADSEHAFTTAMSNSYGGFTSFRPFDGGPSFGIPRSAADMVRTLLDRPRAEVGTTIEKQWEILTTDDTTLDQAAGILGAPVPQQGQGGTVGPC